MDQTPVYELVSLDKSRPSYEKLSDSNKFVNKMKEITKEYLNYNKNQINKELHPIYYFNNQQETEEYILYHDDLIPLLKVAPKIIDKYFPEKEQLILEYVPDSEFDYGELFLYIKTNCTADEAITNMKNINQDLFYSEYSKALPKVIIYVKFS
jgi:hypothetical protein